MPEDNIQDVLKALHDAEQEYQDAARAVSMAEGRQCTAVNRLNAVQKAFDRLTAEVKAQASKGSDWQRERDKKDARVSH